MKLQLMFAAFLCLLSFAIVPAEAAILDLSVTLISDTPSRWMEPRHLEFTLTARNVGAEDQLVTITRVLSTLNGDVLNENSGSIYVLAHQSYIYTWSETTWESGALKLSVSATGVPTPVVVLCDPQPPTTFSIGFMVEPLGLFSLPLMCVSICLAIYGIREEQDGLTFLGSFLAFGGAVLLVLFGQVWLNLLSQVAQGLN